MMGNNSVKCKQVISPRDDHRKIAILIAIDKIPNATAGDLVKATNMSKRCIHSTLGVLRSMKVEVLRKNGRRHGYYHINDPGIFNIDRLPGVLKLEYPQILQRIELFAQTKELLLDS